MLRATCYRRQGRANAAKPGSTGFSSLSNAQFVAAANLNAVYSFFLARQPRVTRANDRGQRTAVEEDPKERGKGQGKEHGLDA